MWPNAQISADLVTFMNKSFMENFIFCAVSKLFLFAKSLCPMSKRRTIHCVKSVHIRSFLVRITVKNIVISRDFLVWKFCGKAQFSQFWASRLKLCGNCAFPQNFQTRKSGEIMVFFAVYFPAFGLNMERYSYSVRMRENTDQKTKKCQCVKSVCVRSFSDPYFSAFGLNLVQMRENTDQKNSEYEHFLRSDIYVCTTEKNLLVLSFAYELFLYAFEKWKVGLGI